jgi:uncharacterized protein (DUF433 family)
MELPAFLTRDAFGEIVLTGHRVGLYTILRYRNDGLTSEQIAALLPTLPLALVQDVLAFAQAHQAEVDAYAEACRAEIERQEHAPPGPGVLRIRGLLQRIQEEDAKRQGDPTWQRLNVIEKLQRIERETGTRVL